MATIEETGTSTDTSTDSSALETAPANERHFDPEASIVLVGCRGAGKRSLGFIGALHLRRRLVTEDHYFKQTVGVSRGEFLRQHGREAFSRRNADVFQQMLEANRRRCIIECGMSSLAEEAQTALRAFCRTNPVIYVHREREQVLRFLDEHDAEQLLRADQSHRQCSNLEYYNLYDPSSGRSEEEEEKNADPDHPPSSLPSRLLSAKEDFTRYLDLLLGQAWRRQWAESPFLLNAVPPEFRAHSSALRLRLSYLMDMDLAWADFEARGDCVELIIDHWPEDASNVVARQVALIRRHVGVPIIYHVEEMPREERSRGREERDRADAALLELGLRLNVEYLSLDLQRSAALVRGALARRGRSSVIGNFWYTGLAAPPWSDAALVASYARAQALGCDVVRIGRFSLGGGHPGGIEQEQPDALKALLAARVPDPKPPLVAFDYSLLGLRTPLQGSVLNPVKHPGAANRRDHLATVTSAASAMQMAYKQGRIDALQFYTIGSHIHYSIMPAIHSAAFAFAGLPHGFQAAECATLDDLRALVLTPDTAGNDTFGGAALAAPFKVAVRPLLALQSPHATALGAVNVILPLRGRSMTSSEREPTALDHANARNKGGVCRAFYGDNTDWRSIHTCLQRAISPRNAVQPSQTTALVIGAGGMARAAIYAMLQLGCRHIFIHNRTRQHAVDVARHFDDWAASQGWAGMATGNICHVLDALSDPWPAALQPPTMVVSCVPAVNMDGSPAADFEMPPQWLHSPTGGVVVELAYEPLITRLVAQMRAFRDTVAPAWVVVDGLEVASEMAIETFELLTGRMAPRRLMRTVCRRAWDQQQRSLLSPMSL